MRAPMGYWEPRHKSWNNSTPPASKAPLNKGALTKTWDQHIAVSRLNLIVNGIDIRKWPVYGLHGQVECFNVKDLKIDQLGIPLTQPDAAGEVGIGLGDGDCAPPPSHTTGRAVFRIRRLRQAL